MNTLPVLTGLAAALLTLSACDSKSPDSSSAPAAQTTVNTPPSGTIPDSVPGTGPGEGGTAIGGVAPNQDGGGASGSDAPAATGGDGSSAATEK